MAKQILGADEREPRARVGFLLVTEEIKKICPRWSSANYYPEEWTRTRDEAKCGFNLLDCIAAFFLFPVGLMAASHAP